jgi:ferredoxin-like protein FixX
MGAVLQPFAPVKFLRIRRAVGSSKEDSNRLLDEVCPMGVRVTDSDDGSITDPACIHCGNCTTAAPDLFSQTI